MNNEAERPRFYVGCTPSGAPDTDGGVELFARPINPVVSDFVMAARVHKAPPSTFNPSRRSGSVLSL